MNETWKNSRRNGRKRHGKIVVNNITNVTDVTNVTVFNTRHGKPHWGKGRRHHRRGEKKPELLRFCASFGLLDRDKVYRMSDGELAKGACDLVRYGAKGFSRSASNMVGHASQCASGICDLLSAFGRLLDLF